MMKERIIDITAYILIFAILCFGLPAYAMDFDDVGDMQWYYTYINEVSDDGLMVGTTQGCFEADAPVTRAMMVQVLYAYNNQHWEHRLSFRHGNIFDDVFAKNWFFEAVYWASGAEITSGTGNNMFSPYRYITREEAYTMIARLFYYREYWVSFGDAAGQTLDEYADKSDVSEWAAEPLEYAAHFGFLSGYSENGKKYIRPKNTITRAELATIIVAMKKGVTGGLG